MSFHSNTIHFDFFTPKKTVVFLCLYPLFSVKYRKGVYIQNTTVFFLTICFRLTYFPAARSSNPYSTAV